MDSKMTPYEFIALTDKEREEALSDIKVFSIQSKDDIKELRPLIGSLTDVFMQQEIIEALNYEIEQHYINSAVYKKTRDLKDRLYKHRKAREYFNSEKNAFNKLLDLYSNNSLDKELIEDLKKIQKRASKTTTLKVNNKDMFTGQEKELKDNIARLAWAYNIKLTDYFLNHLIKTIDPTTQTKTS